MIKYIRTYPHNDSRYFNTCKRLKSRNVSYTSGYASWDKKDITIIAYNISYQHIKFLKHLNFKEVVSI